MIRIILFSITLSIASIPAQAWPFQRRNSSSFLFGGLVVAAVVMSAAQQACRNKDGSLKEKCKSKSIEDTSHDPDDSSHTNTAVLEMENPDSEAFLKSAHTAELRKGLDAELIDAGMPPDPDDCDAHHIVPKNEGRKWAKSYADNARQILESCNIDIDSAMNGIYLPGKDASRSKCHGSYHKTLHNKVYYEDIHSRLQGAYRSGDCDNVIEELKAIKNDLSNKVY